MNFPSFADEAVPARGTEGRYLLEVKLRDAGDQYRSLGVSNFDTLYALWFQLCEMSNVTGTRITCQDTVTVVADWTE